jgi:hypothetical protein
MEMKFRAIRRIFTLFYAAEYNVEVSAYTVFGGKELWIV